MSKRLGTWAETDSTSKRQKIVSDPNEGRPTQVHAVPWHERAVDSQGRRLPWGLEWHEDHPNGRGQKRHIEEKGPFGKYKGRRSSLHPRKPRAAKKEDPAVDAFGRAMEHDLQKRPEEARHQSVPSIGAQNVRPVLSMTKEPTQVMLYGFSPSTQWAAISFYETVSSGIICEDYEREPPFELRRYRNQIGTASSRYPRGLTKAELALVRQYRGGNCWIKVTFDSAEAAERAIYHSPHLLQGHWVYAEPFYDVEPVDEPVPMREEDRGQGVLGTPRRAPMRAHRPSQAWHSGTVQKNKISSGRGANTLPRPLTGNATINAEAQSAAGPSARSSSATASSATAAASTVVDHKQQKGHSRQPRATTTTKNRNSNNGTNKGQAASLEPPPPSPPPARDPHYFTHFPTVPRTILRPAHEAFLPQPPTWLETTIARLVAGGWLPDDIIGNVVPRLENGDFDSAHASLYWKIFHCIDSHFGTDFCCMKGEE